VKPEVIEESQYLRRRLDYRRTVVKIKPSGEVNGVCVCSKPERLRVQKFLEDRDGAIVGPKLVQTRAHSHQRRTRQAAEKRLHATRKVEVVHNLLHCGVVRKTVEELECAEPCFDRVRRRNLRRDVRCHLIFGAVCARTMDVTAATPISATISRVVVFIVAILGRVLPFVRIVWAETLGRQRHNDKCRGSLRLSYKRVAEIGKNLAGSDNRVRCHEKGPFPDQRFFHTVLTIKETVKEFCAPGVVHQRNPGRLFGARLRSRNVTNSIAVEKRLERRFVLRVS
jgi:hypothetical protein